jgi:flagellar basal-body rod modification protein FlgD
MSGVTGATSTTTNTTNNFTKADEANATKTARGTAIVKKGQDMDKNAFFKILAAELSNQDPQNAQDGTAYVSQMAQFSSLEQMVNLNDNVKFTQASSLIGKTVTLNKLDANGNFYSGVVSNVVKSGDTIQLNVAVGKEKDKDGNTVDNLQKFDIDDLTEIDNPSTSTSTNAGTNASTNTSASTSSSK